MNTAKSKGEDKGDFIEKYTLFKSFKLSRANGKLKTESELANEIKQFTDSIREIENAITIDTRKIGNHVYEPLLRERVGIIGEKRNETYS